MTRYPHPIVIFADEWAPVYEFDAHIGYNTSFLLPNGSRVLAEFTHIHAFTPGSGYRITIERLKPSVAAVGRHWQHLVFEDEYDKAA